jgi:hypothetical protein
VTLREAAGAERVVALLAARILTVSAVALSGRDLVAAGVVSGRWQRLEAELALGLALSDMDAPSRDDVDGAVREFRYARRLTSGQDFRRWLEQRELSLGDVRGAMERGLARRSRRAVAAPAPADRDRALAALPAEAVCSGALRDCGWWLADRLLAAEAPDRSPATIDDPRLHDVAASAAELVAVAAMDEPEDVRLDRLARVLDADGAFAAHAVKVVSPTALARCVELRRLDWLAFELEGLLCPSRPVAAEAATQLRHDGIALGDVARAAGLEPQHRTLLLDDAPGSLRTLLAAAAAGDVLGPAELDGVHELWLVTRRTQPDARDPVVHERAAAAVLAADTERRRAGRVGWHDRD